MSGRPAEQLLAGYWDPDSGGMVVGVVLSPRVCRYLLDTAHVDKFAGADPELDRTLAAMERARSSDIGTKHPDSPEPAPRLKKQPIELLSTTDAGNLLGISDRAIRKAIQGGRLKATPAGANHIIKRTDLEAFRASRAQ